MYSKASTIHPSIHPTRSLMQSMHTKAGSSACNPAICVWLPNREQPAHCTQEKLGVSSDIHVSRPAFRHAPLTHRPQYTRTSRPSTLIYNTHIALRGSTHRQTLGEILLTRSRERQLRSALWGLSPKRRSRRPSVLDFKRNSQGINHTRTPNDRPRDGKIVLSTTLPACDSRGTRVLACARHRGVAASRV